MSLLGRHRFLPTSNRRDECHICMKAKEHAIHNCSDEQPTDLMPRATDDNHETEDLQQGDLCYIDAGSVKITIYRECSGAALLKAQGFLAKAFADRP